MYSVDDTIKALALAPARHVYSLAILGTKSGNSWDNDRTYTDTDHIISAKIDIGSSSGGLTIGAAYSAKLTLRLMGDVTVNQTDRIIMRVGFYKSDGTKSDPIGLGWFYVDTITRKDNITTIVAYDKMLRGAKIYKPTALTFPCRASAILDDICDKMGVSLRDGVTLPYDPIINEAPTKSKGSDGNTLYYTRREILGYLASIMGGNWFFDAGGHLAFTQFTAVSDTFAAANSTAADISSDAYAVTGITWNINGVPYSRFDDEDAAGMLEFSNPLKVDAKEPIMGAVEQRLVGLTYHSGTIQRQGCGWFELGDIVTAYRKDGTSALVLLTGINYSIESGAFTEKIFSSALSDSESNYTSGDISGQTVPQSVAQEEAANTSGSTSPLTEYEYLTDLSAKCNGVTYTVEKDAGTGLIARISDSNGNEFKPTINSGITDVSLHNAVFWAVAMSRGFSAKINDNIIINPTLEINQRGQTTYSGAGIFTVDHWYLGAGGVNCIVFTDNVDYLRISATASDMYKGIWEKVENYSDYAGKTLTLTAKVRSNTSLAHMTLSDGTKVRAYHSGSGEWEELKITHTVSSSPTELAVGLGFEGGSADYWIEIDRRSMKLEVSDFATKFVVPDKAAELRKCQRYYQVHDTGDIAFSKLDPPMAKTPTITLRSDGKYAYDAETM